MTDSFRRYGFRLFLLPFVVAMGVFFPDLQEAVASVNIRLAVSAEVMGDEVTLGDIATVLGNDRGVSENIQRTKIGRSPLVGQTRVVDRDLVLIRLRQHGADTQGVIVSGAESVAITRASMSLAPDQMAAVVHQWVSEKLKTTAGNATIESIRIDREVTLPKGKLAYRVLPLKHISMEGKFPLPVELLVNGTVEKKVMAVVTVKHIQEAVIVLRPVRKGQVLAPEDVGIKEMDASELSSNSIRRLDEAIGKRLRRNVDAFDVLRTDLLDLPPVVKRGDVVQVIAESDTLKLKTLGVVKNRGAHIGERIQVVNMDSSRIIYAKVIDAKTVKVEF